jgi:hypothetical protein
MRALAALELAPSAVVLDGPWNLLRERAGAAVDPGGTDDGQLRFDMAVGPPAEVHGPPVPAVALPEVVVPLIGADARCAAVAAASILAKVVRDRMMRAEAPHFPAYGFEANKGYPSPLHKMALRGYGLSSIHRRSWAFVDDLPYGRRAGRPWLAAATAPAGVDEADGAAPVPAASALPGSA